MLSHEALNSAQPLTQVFDDRGMFLVPVAGSPLEALVNATRSSELFTSRSDAGEVNISVADIEFMANAKDPVLDCSPHDRVMDELTETCVKAVQGHMQFARTVVAPAVSELVEKTAASLNELTPSSLLGMSVVTWAPPAPMTLPAMETMARRFEDVAFDVPKLALRLPNMTAKDIVALMSTGTGSVDAAIAEWAAGLGESYFIELWENVFQMKPAELGGSPRNFRDWTEDRDCGLDHALAIFLLSRRLFDQGPPEGTEMPLPAYEASVVEFRNQAAARLARGFDELALIRSGKMLVRKIEGSTTTVNESVYREWLEQGGDNDALFGNVLDAPSVTTVDLINEKAEKLRARWRQHAALTATVESVRNFNRTREILQRHFNDMMREITEGEEATEGNREMVIKLFGEQLSLVREDDLKDLWGLCLRLVCRSRFYRTEAERILSGIERIKKDNPTIDVREAAAVSMIEYIGYWVSTQFRVQVA